MIDGLWQLINQDVSILIGKLLWIMEERSAAASLIGAFATTAGLFFAGWQILSTRREYKEERQWKRSEVVRSHLSEMVNNPNIALVSCILDWRGGPGRIPEPFQPLFDALVTAGPMPDWHSKVAAKGYFEISWDRFVRSLAVKRDIEWRSADMFMYRTCFDSFCAFLQGVADDVRSIGVQEAEYADLSFYCHRVVLPKDATRSDHPEAGVVMRAFIEEYYNARTFEIIIRHAEVYARNHRDDGMPLPSELFPDLFQAGLWARIRKWTGKRRATALLARQG